MKEIIKEKSVDLIVLGLPKRTDDSLGPEAQRVMEFGKLLEKECGIRLKLFDESYTTKEADEILIKDFNLSRKKRKEVKDSLAACLILNSYMRSVQ